MPLPRRKVQRRPSEEILCAEIAAELDQPLASLDLPFPCCVVQGRSFPHVLWCS
jgi:hypothetical protein